jgi:hypothetical protein
MARILFVFGLLPIVTFSACKRAETGAAPSTPSPPPAKALPKIEACSLITKEEVGAVQKTTITDTKSSETSDGRHVITQCYYASADPNLSVSLTLTQPGNASSPREYWNQTFGPYRNRQSQEEKQPDKAKKEGTTGRPGEEGEKKTPPKKIDGIGEEGFWSGTRVGGALYVLYKDYIVRISIGGPDAEEIRIKKSQALVQKALQRL